VFRKVRRRRKSRGAGKGKRRSAKNLRNEVRNAIGSTGQACIFEGRAILAHPANGASLATTRHGKSIDRFAGRVTVRLIRTGEEFMSARSVTRAPNLGSIEP
jgi:hypothetical protein